MKYRRLQERSSSSMRFIVKHFMVFAMHLIKVVQKENVPAIFLKTKYKNVKN